MISYGFPMVYLRLLPCFCFFPKTPRAGADSSRPADSFPLPARRPGLWAARRGATNAGPAPNLGRRSMSGWVKPWYSHRETDPDSTTAAAVKVLPCTIRILPVEPRSLRSRPKPPRFGAPYDGCESVENHDEYMDSVCYINVDIYIYIYVYIYMCVCVCVCELCVCSVYLYCIHIV